MTEQKAIQLIGECGAVRRALERPDDNIDAALEEAYRRAYAVITELFTALVGQAPTLREKNDTLDIWFGHPPRFYPGDEETDEPS